MLKKNWLQTKSYKTQNDHLWTKYFITYGTFKHIFWHFFSDDLDINYHFVKVYDWHDITIENWDRSFFSLRILLLVRLGREHEICNNFVECLRKQDQYCPWSNNQVKTKFNYANVAGAPKNESHVRWKRLPNTFLRIPHVTPWTRCDLKDYKSMCQKIMSTWQIFILLKCFFKYTICNTFKTSV